MPQEVREVLDVQEGDIVEFEVIAVRRRGRNEPSVALSSKSNPTNLLEGPAQ